jgi:hypothetical protein
VYQLLGDQTVLSFIGTTLYYEHKAARFRTGDEPDIKRNEAFILSDRATRERYAKEFLRTQALYYGGFPSFDAILSRIQEHVQKL